MNENDREWGQLMRSHQKTHLTRDIVKALFKLAMWGLLIGLLFGINLIIK